MEKTVATLARLPVDILCEITPHLLAKHVSLLWLCGDASLNGALGNRGGVKHWIERSFQNAPSSWPSLPSFLHHLTHFEISMPAESYNDYPLRLQLLPSSVRVLKLKLHWAERAWLPANRQTSYYDWCAHFAQLETLYLEGQSCWTSESLRFCLPPSLRSLSLISNASITSLQHLPPLLTDLRMPRYSTLMTTIEEAKQLPKHLTRLHTSILFSCHVVAFLPANLQKFRYIMHYTDADAQLGCENMPRNITKLHLMPPPTPFDQTALSALPPLIMSLKLLMTFGTVITDFKLLPRSIKSLTCYGPDISTRAAQIFASLPPTLTELNLPLPNMMAEDVLYIPRSVTAFYATGTRFTSEFFAHLPPALKTLHVAPCSGIPTFNFAHLPRTIVELSLGECSFGEMEPEKLPPNLKILRFNCEQTTAKHLEALPIGLLELSISHLNASVALESLCKLPKTLRTLFLRTLTECDVESLKKQELPPCLEYFVLEQASNRHVIVRK